MLLVRASINGEPRDFPDGLTLEHVLETLGSPQRGIAVAKNGVVVPRSMFSREVIQDGDLLEIIKAVAGG